MSALDELKLRRAEPSLLHRQVDLADLMVLKEIQSGSGKRYLTEAAASQDHKAAALWVVHLWAVECAPCVAELPLLRDIVNGIQRSPLASRVRFAFITETYDDNKLSEFISRHRAELPSLPILRSPETDRRLRNGLQLETQPITLLIDRNGTIRHALLGSFKERRGELAGAIARLEHLSK